VDAIGRAQALLDTYVEQLLRELPPEVRVFDVHTHLGRDIDGMVGELEELLDVQQRSRVERSFVFCLDEPDRHPAFRAANDRTLAFAARSEGALVPFVRLDLNESPLEEAVRCIDLGAGGIKLHPRAQRFLPDDPRLEPVFELAADRRVPILIHGGRGLPPIADGLARLVDRYGPTLIIAHAGIVDLAAMARHFGGRPGVFFDTSVWSPIDLLDLYRLVSPEQVVYASD
jgi:predicted TIM-barrel fold metal-dependent hydrolase